MIKEKELCFEELVFIISRIFVCICSSRLKRNPPTNSNTKIIFIFIDLYLGVPVGTSDSFLSVGVSSIAWSLGVFNCPL